MGRSAAAADQAPPVAANQPPAANQIPPVAVPVGNQPLPAGQPGPNAQSLEEDRLRAQALASVTTSHSLVARALYDLPTLTEKDYEIWVTALGDALYGAGMDALFTVTSRQRDDEASPQDVAACGLYPDWQVQAAWKAIRRSISPDSPVYAKSSTIRRGDLKGLIRTVRFFFERNTVNVQHEILGKIRHTQQADYPNFRGYVAALEAHFIRLAKMGQALTDDFKRYFLLEGLAEDFRRGMHGTILAYETPDGRPCSYEKAVQLLTSWGDGQSSTSQRGRPDTAMPVQSAHQQVVRSPCLQFSRRGRCKWGKACRFLHVDAPGRQSQVHSHPPFKRGKPAHSRVPTTKTRKPPQSPKAKKPFQGQCFRCGRHGNRKTSPIQHLRVVMRHAL